MVFPVFFLTFQNKPNPMPKRTLIIAHCYECAHEIAEQEGIERFDYVYSTANLKGVRPEQDTINSTIYIQDNPPTYKRNWGDIIAEARQARKYDGFKLKRVKT